jgi:hypothetical protein
MDYFDRFTRCPRRLVPAALIAHVIVRINPVMMSGK